MIEHKNKIYGAHSAAANAPCCVGEAGTFSFDWWVFQVTFTVKIFVQINKTRSVKGKLQK